MATYYLVKILPKLHENTNAFQYDQYCPLVTVWRWRGGVSVQRVSVQGVSLSRGGLCPGCLCPEGLCPGGSVPTGVKALPCHNIVERQQLKKLDREEGRRPKHATWIRQCIEFLWSRSPDFRGYHQTILINKFLPTVSNSRRFGCNDEAISTTAGGWCNNGNSYSFVSTIYSMPRRLSTTISFFMCSNAPLLLQFPTNFTCPQRNSYFDLNRTINTKH